ncbi:MAG: hypothetical protein L6R40_000640 [Gallowayella cf. fulva]|nr:MAG: hypothetical protein L6R40_000640 [Xanthomendoza cf. fulva]
MHLPIPMDTSDQSGTHAATLSFPLRPDTVPWLHIQLGFDDTRYARPDGGQQVMSLAASIYYSWIDRVNLAIDNVEKARRIPFPDFLYTLTPSSGRLNALTPFKIGIAYCQTLEFILNQPAFYGYLRIDLIERRYSKTGRVEIANSPKDASAPSTMPNVQLLGNSLSANETYRSIAQPSHSLKSSTESVGIPGDIEKRWFKCLSTMLFYIIAKLPRDWVSSELPRPQTYLFECEPDDPRDKDEIVVLIYPAAQKAEYRMVWESMAKTLLLLGTRIAEEKTGMDHAQLVVAKDGTVTAAIGISLDGVYEVSATA